MIFKVVIFNFIFLVCFFSSQSVSFAHPGRTDEDGGHYCHTNCEEWGLEYEEYHYHDGEENEEYYSDEEPESEEKNIHYPVWTNIVFGCSIPLAVYLIFRYIGKKYSD